MKPTRRDFMAKATAAAAMTALPVSVPANPQTIEERILALLPQPPDDLIFREYCRLRFVEMRNKGLLSPSCAAVLEDWRQ